MLLAPSNLIILNRCTSLSTSLFKTVLSLFEILYSQLLWVLLNIIIQNWCESLQTTLKSKLLWVPLQFLIHNCWESCWTWLFKTDVSPFKLHLIQNCCESLWITLYCKLLWAPLNFSQNCAWMVQIKRLGSQESQILNFGFLLRLWEWQLMILIDVNWWKLFSDLFLFLVFDSLRDVLRVSGCFPVAERHEFWHLVHLEVRTLRTSTPAAVSLVFHYSSVISLRNTCPCSLSLVIILLFF